MNTNANKDRQRKFKSKMYDAGFKRIYLWVKKEPAKKLPSIGKEAFDRKMEKLLPGFNPRDQGKLLYLIIEILEGKKKVLKLRKKEKKNMPGAKGGKKGRGQQSFGGKP